MVLSSAHRNMIQQVRTWNVSDLNLLDLFASVSRELFVPEPYTSFAYTDAFVPIGHKQVILPANITARMLDALQVTPQESVLEIGAGTGYTAILLSHLARHITALELIPELAQYAAKNCQKLNRQNISIQNVTGAQGWLNAAPYDVIVMSGSVHSVPQILGEQLNPRGRLFAVVGTPPATRAVLLTKIDETHFEQKTLFETHIPPLVGVSNC